MMQKMSRSQGNGISIEIQSSSIIGRQAKHHPALLGITLYWIDDLGPITEPL